MIATGSNTKLVMIRGATEYPLFDGSVIYNSSDGPVELYYIADDGLGMAPIIRFSERGPSQHGDTDLGFILEPRTISYIFGIYAPGIGDSRHLDTARMLLLKQFRPSNDTVSFRYTRPNGDVLQIDGHFTGGMQFGSSEREPGTWFQRFSVDFKMSDPTWYVPTQQSYTVVNDVWTNGFSVPVAIPFYVGEPHFDFGQTIVYNGSWETYPVLTINGPIINPTITNQELELELPFTGSIEKNTYWRIDLSSGLKSVVNANGTSMMQYVSDPNNLDTFRIAAAPDVVDGINTIWMTGDGADFDTTLDIAFYERHIGI